MTASETEATLQTSTYDGETKALNWENYASCHVKYHIILKILMEYGYQELGPGTQVCHMTRCPQQFAIKAHPDRYKKKFDLVVT